MKTDLIREIIRLELLYRSRNQKKIFEAVEEDDDDVTDNLEDEIYSDEEEELDEPLDDKGSGSDEKETNQIVPSNRTGNAFNNLFTSQPNKNIEASTIKAVLNAEKTNDPSKHQNDLKEVVYDFFKSKKLSDSQCASIYQSIYLKKDNINYLESLIKFNFNKYTLSKIEELIIDLNKNLDNINNKDCFDYDIYRNNTSPSSSFSIGKGEFLLLCYLSDAKSGLTAGHDIIGLKAEYEVKQSGTVDNNTVDFKTKIRRKTQSDSAQKAFLDDVNSFIKKFIESTKNMDEILNLSSQYESAYILEEYTTYKKVEGAIAKPVAGDTINALGELDDFYDGKKDLVYFATIFSGLSAVLSNQHEGAAYTDVADHAKGVSKNYDFANEMRKFLPIMDFISGRSGVKKDAVYNKNFNEESFNKLKKLYFKFSKDAENKNKPKIEIVDTSSSKFQKVKKNDNSYRITPVITVLKNIKELADANNLVKNNEIIHNIAATSLSQWFQIYFNMIIKEYKNALGFYNKMLNDLLNATNGNPAIKYDLIADLQNADKKVSTHYLKYKKFGSEENLKQLLNYKIFLDFWKGLSFKDEVVIDIKHYDDNNQLKHRKQIINTIGDEFQILEPSSNNQIGIEKFFKDVKNDDIFNLQVKNENMSEQQFEDVMKAKEIFSFLNDNINSKSKNNDAENNINIGIEKPKLRNKSSSNIVEMLDDLIESLLNLHKTVYDEYTKPEGKDNKTGGLIYIAEKGNVSNFNLIFNHKNKNEYEDNAFKDMESFKNFIKTKADNNEIVPIIKDIGNSELHWTTYNPESQYLLTELLDMKNLVAADLNEINEYVSNIKKLIGQLISKNSSSKNLNNILKPR